MANVRFETRLPEDYMEMLERISSISGKSKSASIRELIEEGYRSKVIEKYLGRLDGDQLAELFKNHGEVST